jgi:hypothetical protein
LIYDNNTGRRRCRYHRVHLLSGEKYQFCIFWSRFNFKITWALGNQKQKHFPAPSSVLAGRNNPEHHIEKTAGGFNDGSLLYK